MSTRKPIVGGNWKMNTTARTALDLSRDVVSSLGAQTDAVDILIFPPFPFLQTVSGELVDSGIKLGAQDVYHEPDGAYTGEVSLNMLKDCGCQWVLVGHSERRHVIGENDELINLKARAALAGGLRIVLCIGETQTQREADQTDAVNIAQLRAGLNEIRADQMSNVVVAYEPVWAIGTGLTATPEDAQAAHRMIRATLAELYGTVVAEATRIQYGGSVKPANAAELMAQADIDGGLIGGASLKAPDFASIVEAAARSRA